MKRKQVRPMRRGGFPIIFSAVLLTALALASQAGTPAAQAAPAGQTPVIQDLEYYMEVGPDEVTLCVGQKLEFHVTVPLVVTERVGTQPPYDINVYYPGEEVRTAVEVPAIGEFSPEAQGTGPGMPAPWRTWSGSDLLTFTFTAKEPGFTIVRFEHHVSAKPLTHARPEEAHVTVENCWEAVTGGLGLEFTEKKICGLKKLFKLQGRGIAEFSGEIPGLSGGIPGLSATLSSSGITESSRAILNTITTFTPSGNGTTGTFSNVDTVTSGPATCVSTTSGTYKLDFHLGTLENPFTEADIVMTGRGSTVCGPVTLPVNNIGTKILIKPNNDLACP